MITHARRTRGIDEILSSLPTRPPEPLLKRFEESPVLLALRGFEENPTEETNSSLVLLPGEISIVAQSLLKFYGLKDKASSYFLNRLIQNSYHAGHNDFDLGTLSQETDWLFAELQGTKKNHLEVKITGSGLLQKWSGGGFGNSARYLQAWIEGETNHLGNYARDSNFYCHKILYDVPGHGARDCRFVIDVIPELSIHPYTKPKHCLYECQNYSHARHLAKVLPEGNRIMVAGEIFRDYKTWRKKW